MPASVNNNPMAANATRNLNSHYGRLATSVARLSSGLRINSAADDAAGLAIRELMRADMAALSQGIRNANDAISMLQVADGALAVIDEKLIRMKELAEQAATGTYNSTQRLMIHSEFAAMGEEIDRIARATDFNGMKLLDGSLSGQHDGKGLNATGAMKIHFGAGNDSAEDYYYVQVANCTLAGLGLGEDAGVATSTRAAPALSPQADGPVAGWWDNAVFDQANKKVVLNISAKSAGSGQNALGDLRGIDYYSLPLGLKNIVVTSNAPNGVTPMHKAHVCLFAKTGHQLTGPPINDDWTPVIDAAGNTDTFYGAEWWSYQDRDRIMQVMGRNGLLNDDGFVLSHRTIYGEGQQITENGVVISLITGQNEIGTKLHPGSPLTPEVIHISEITDDLVFLIGGHAPPSADKCNQYSLRIEADYTDDFLNYIQTGQRPAPPAPNPPGQDALQAGAISIKTQEEAQKALERIDDAIIAKDKVRAHLGALQNRLENTVANLAIQNVNMQAAESRISDADIALEMTAFVRQQVLTQSATAMLGQANSYPHMLMGLING